VADGMRVIWTSPCGGFRLISRIWEDGGPPSYGAQWFDGYWRWAEGSDEMGRVLVAVARWLDNQGKEEGKP